MMSMLIENLLTNGKSKREMTVATPRLKEDISFKKKKSDKSNVHTKKTSNN